MWSSRFVVACLLACGASARLSADGLMRQQQGQAVFSPQPNMEEEAGAADESFEQAAKSVSAQRNSAFEGFMKQLTSMTDSIKDLSDEAVAVWDSVMTEMPFEAVDSLWAPRPKKEVVSSDEGEWDHTVKNAYFPEHQLRVKSPDALGVDSVKQYSGYLDVSDQKHFFYWFFESRNDPENDPLVLWLNGGPGCSSMTGLFMELGPSSVSKDGKTTVYNPHSWNSNASVIFLDQPINVGYSYGDEGVSDTVAAGKDVYALLSLFFEQFPEYAKLDFSIAGESYAGHYIPQFAREIWDHTEQRRTDFYAADLAATAKPNFSLKSVLIGNGLTDPLVQYKYYSSMACNNSYEPVLTQEQCQAMDDAYPRCASLIQSCYDSGSAWTCVPAALYCNNAMMGPYQRTGRNVYDVRGECEDPEALCYPIMKWIESYLNQEHVMKAVGAQVSSFESCNMNINRNFLFKGDWMKGDFVEDARYLLDEGLPMLVYAGDADFICNWMGNAAWTDQLEWTGKDAYSKESIQKWITTYGEHAGNIKKAKNLTFLRVFGAGHMVPYDQPESGLDMLNSFLSGSL